MFTCSACKVWLGLIDEIDTAFDDDEPLICPVSGWEISVHKAACPKFEQGMTLSDHIARRVRIINAYSTMGYDSEVPR